MTPKPSFQSIIDAKVNAATPKALANSTAPKKSAPFFDPISWAVIIGVGGLIIGTFLFLFGDKPYGEIAIDKKPLWHALIDHRLKCLNDNIAFQTKRIKSATGLKKLDSVVFKSDKDPDSLKEWFNTIHNAQVAIKTSEGERLKMDKGNTDTSLINLAIFTQVNQNDYLAALTGNSWKVKNDSTYVDLQATLLDTCHACLQFPQATSHLLRLYQHKRDNPIDFFRDYPAFGLWLVFSIAQLVLWALLLPFLYGNITVLNGQLVNPGYQIQTRQVLKNSILPAVIIAIFCFLFYHELIGQWLVTDAAFLSGLQLRVIIYAVLGYLIAALCFGSYITLTRKLDEIDADVKGKLKRGDSEHLDDTYKALRAAFGCSFYGSALILSFVVFWTGILVSGVNGTEGMRFYFLLSKKDFIPTDFVFLLGLMHTIILLIFYIPAKLKFSSMSLTQQAPDDDKGAGGLFSALGSSLGPLLLTASPLLAGLVNSLLGLLVKN